MQWGVYCFEGTKKEYYIGSICPTFVRIPDRETEIPKHKEVLCWNELCMVINLDLKKNNLSVVKKQYLVW